MTTIWIRAEMKPRERRAPLAPAACAALLSAGYDVRIEESAARAIPTARYAEAGCAVEAEGAWREAPEDAWIVAVKEMPEADSFPLSRRHIHFGHMFKNQEGWREGLGRFVAGGGALYDLENLTDETGRRVAAFGYWAGFAGAALGAKLWAGLADGARPGLSPIGEYADREALIADVRAALGGRTPSALVTGALGRCGSGARDFFDAVGIAPTGWDMKETASGGPFPEILAHDIFVNAVLASPTCPVFVPRDAAHDPARRLTAISDVSCDPGSSYNPIPVYDRTTTFDDPAILAPSSGAPLAVTAIDHLPSLLPVESTEDYSAQLLPAMLTLDGDRDGVWARAKADFDAAVARM